MSSIVVLIGRVWRPLKRDFPKIFAAASLAVIAVISAVFPAFAQVAHNPADQPVELERPVHVEDEKDTLDRLVGYAQIITAVGVPFLLLQLIWARNEGRRQRTRGFQERYLDREFQKSASLTIAFLDVDGVEDCVAKIRAFARRSYVGEPCLPRTPRAGDEVPKAAVLDVSQAMGFFEDFGTAFNRRDLDKGVVRDSFAGTPVQVFCLGWWYICWQRQGKFLGETRLYREFELVVKSLQRGVPDLAGVQPKEGVRLLCLPAAEEAARYADWEYSRRLSKALNELTQHLDEALDEIVTIGGVTRDRRSAWRTIVIPPTLHVERDFWQWKRQQADAIARRLSVLDRDVGIKTAIDRLDALARRRAASAAAYRPPRAAL